MLNESSGNRKAYIKGLKDGIPIGAAYFAVAFSLGIAARNAGLTPFQGFMASFLTSASAGEHAGFALIAEGGTYLEMVLVSIIASARYLLMSCALSQKLHPGIPLIHRILLGNWVTDEFFGITMAQPGYANPYYTYGAITIGCPCWAFGTQLGLLLGNILPAKLVCALGVALYGMFIAIVVPPAKDNRPVMGVVLASFALSFGLTKIQVFSGLSSGMRVIILTVVIAAIAAYFFPVKEDGNE